MTIGDAYGAVLAEYTSACSHYPPMVSLHEGHGIILEELEELWEEIRKKPAQRAQENLRKEATQLAAMALRFLTDLT